MAYTNGSQTISKSMNGIITIDSGGGITIEGDTITTPRLVVTTNTSLSTTAVTGTCSFNNFLPTSSQTSAPNNNQFITRSLANGFYGQLATAITNTWLSTNLFNAILPTSTLIGTPSATQIAPLSMLQTVLAPIANPTFTGTVNIHTPNILSFGTGLVGSLTNMLNTGLDGASATVYNLQIGSWFGIGFKCLLDNITRIYFDTRTGTITGSIINAVSTLQVAGANINTLFAPIVTGGYARLSTVDNAFLNDNTYVNLPSTTTTLTTATTNQFITKNIADTLYVATGGYARLSLVDNVFLNNNAFNSNLPTSTLTGTPSATQIAPVSMLSSLYARLANINNFTDSCIFSQGLEASFISTLYILWSINPLGEVCESTFNQVTGVMKNVIGGSIGTLNRFDFGFLDGVPPNLEVIRFRIAKTVSTFFTGVQIKTPDTTTTTTPALTIENTEATPSAIKFLLNSTAVAPNLIAGDDAIYSNGVLNLTTTSASACNIRISATDVALTATTIGLNGTDVNINSTGTLAISGSTATTFVNLPSTTTTLTSATANQFITKNIADNYYADEVTGGYARLSSLDNSFLNNNSFVNLPSTTTTLTSATANQFITKNIADNYYADEVTGGYARLSSLDNSFLNNNSFGGGTTSLTSTNISLFSNNTVLSTTVTNQSSNIGLVVKNANSTGLINFVPCANTSAFNPTVGYFDSVISSGPYNNNVLNLAPNSSTATGVRITHNGFVTITGGEMTIKGNQTGATGGDVLIIENSETTPSSIRYILRSNANSLKNPMVLINDNLIYGSTGKDLVLTTVSATACGIRISSNEVTITGTATIQNLNATTINISSITPAYATLPTFTNTQVGYTETVNGASNLTIIASTIICTTTVLPIGVYMVSAYVFTGKLTASAINSYITVTVRNSFNTILKRTKNFYPVYDLPNFSTSVPVNIVFPYRVTTPQSLRLNVEPTGGTLYWDNASPTFTDPPPYLEVVRIA